MLILGVFVGLVIWSANTASPSQLEGSAFEPVTDFAPSIFVRSAFIGLVSVVIGGIPPVRVQRRRTKDPLERIRSTKRHPDACLDPTERRPHASS